MKMIYIAGPYRSELDWEVWQNIMLARDYAILIWEAGGIPITPHLYSMMMGGILPIEEFLKRDCEVISRCDAIFLIGSWQSSEGSLVEKKFAEENGILIFTNMVDVRVYLEKE